MTAVFLAVTVTGQTYVYTPEDSSGSVNYDFWIDYPGWYVMDMKTIAPDTSHDSFWIGHDGENAKGNDAYQYNIPETSSFVWDTVILNQWSGEAQGWYLSSGAHTFTVYGREVETLLDALTLKQKPGSCNCSSWSSGACGAGGCGYGYYQQTRSCNPAGCDQESTCSYSSSCTTDTACTPYEQRDCTVSSAKGICRDGTQSCTSSGSWDSCQEPASSLEICGDNLDNDCDGETDEGCSGICDTDHDGYDTSSTFAVACGTSQPDTDCDDDDPGVNPGAQEVCGNSVDENCDGVIATCDDTPPTITMTGPSDGSTFTSPAKIKLTAYGSDDHGIVKVRFQEGSDIVLYEDTQAPWEYLLTSVPKGNYVYQAIAFDSKGQTDTDAISVTVQEATCSDGDNDGYGVTAYGCASTKVDCNDNNDNIHPGAFDECENGIDEDCSGSDAQCDNLDPTVEITKPADGSRVTDKDTVTFSAYGADSDGTIERVRFYDDGGHFDRSDYSAPYSVTFTAYGSSAYGADTWTLHARAYDDEGATATDTASLRITECTPGDSRSCSTGYKGVCSSGKQACDSSGEWASCSQNTQATTEVCDNNLDDDCDGYADMDDSQCKTWCDTDQDGYDEFVWCVGGGPNTDCNDDNPDVNPGAKEICGNSVDENCDDVLENCPNQMPWVNLVTPYGYVSYKQGTKVTLKAKAGDTDGSVSKVYFYDDGSTVGTDTSADSSDHYTTSWTAYGIGEHTIKARSRDNEDGYSSYDSQTVKVTECSSGETKSCSTGKSGICSAGTRTCSAAGSWGSCSQDRSATTEDCSNGKDDDCDGYTDGHDVDSCNKAPSVTMTAPSDGSTHIGHKVKFTAYGSDDHGITKVKFYDVDQTYYTDYSVPYEWTWSDASYGDHRIYAKAYDEQSLTDTDSALVKMRECSSGSTQTCSTGKKGICSSGTRTCSSSGYWGSCVQKYSSSSESSQSACTDNKDNDCDGYTDMSDSSCKNECDYDGDGYNAYTWCGGKTGDCNDHSSSINPGRSEVCGNGKDDDCSGGDANCKPTVSIYSPSYYKTYGQNDKVYVKATAADTGGSISAVYFYIDSSYKSSDSSKDSNGYYTYTWTAYGIQDHEIKVRSKDNTGTYSNYDYQNIKVTAYG